MRIAFYAGSCLPIHAQSIDERPLGGTETALIRLAEELQRRGHDVSVFTSHKAPPASRPAYLPVDQVFRSGIFDVFVCVKDWKPAVSRAPGKRFFFWTGDGYDQYVNFGLGDARVARSIEKFLAVSEWHRQTLCEASGFPLSQSVVIGNGVHLDYFKGSEQRAPKRLIYTAAPYRGLALLPPIYQELKRRHPEAELHVFAGMSVYDTDQPFRGPQVAEFERLKRELVTLPGCTLHGNVRQQQLARELMRSAVLVYPNTTFETCCIVALEAQAAGCPVVASANSALPETVGEGGFVIDGEPGSATYSQKFLEAVDTLVSDTAAWQRFSRAARRRIEATYTWGNVADRFETLL
ncbi:MAG: glycosyltransferase family 4 protein [Bdellovibrionota bacterium]